MPSPSIPPHEVVITGVGIVTALGVGWKANAEGFRDGRVALKEVTVFNTAAQRVHIAGEVPLPAMLPPHSLSPKDQSRLERGGKLLLHAASEALEAASVAPSTPLDLVLGTSAGAMAHGEEFYRRLRQSSSRKGQAVRAYHYLISNQATLLARAYALEARTTILSNACASGANALGHAAHLIQTGRTAMALAGGYDALSHLVFAGFDALKALSVTLPRPFDAGRDGLALGEGAALLVMESRAHAEARGATILARLVGYGFATDLHHLTQPHPEGHAAQRSMTMACRAANLQPSQIDYLNSHGTGTPLNDPAEAAAIAAWAGNAAAALPVSSTKGSIGHLLGGAGAVEAVVCLMAMREGFLPPTVHHRETMPGCPFDLITTPRNASVRTALTNSFGFGGSNATLIFQA